MVRQTTNDMVGSWFFDENFTGVSEEFNFNGVYEEFFDDVIGSLDDFPLEDVEGNAGEEDWNTKLQYLDPPSMDVLVGFPSKPDKNHSIAVSFYFYFYFLPKSNLSSILVAFLYGIDFSSSWNFFFFFLDW